MSLIVLLAAAYCCFLFCRSCFFVSLIVLLLQAEQFILAVVPQKRMAAAVQANLDLNTCVRALGLE